MIFRGFSHIYVPQQDMNTQGAEVLETDDKKETSFSLMFAMRKLPILTSPDYNNRFFVHEEALKFAVGVS